MALRILCLLPGLAVVLAGKLWAQGAAIERQFAVPKPGQAQIAGQFLRAVLLAKYAVAYGRLAPEVRRVVRPAAFETAALPLYKAGRHGAPLELYKLGMRLGDGGTSRLFYSFAFAADSALPEPSVLFEVTFRDTAARGILGFGLGRTALHAPHSKGSANPHPRR